MTDVQHAVQTWLKAEGGDRPSGEGKATKVGVARRAMDRGDGWFTVPAKQGTFDDTDIDDAHLAPANGAEEIRFNIREAVQDQGRLYVRVAPHAPEAGLYLWKLSRPAGQLVKSLLEGLSRIDGSGLVSAFGRGTPDPLPQLRPVPDGWNFNEGQRAAFTACAASGLHLVWGPPGTGKTTVITRFLEHAVTSGKSVLLVSSTNVAVDNALERAAKRMRPEPGVMIRVGTPHLTEIANNAAVSLTKLKESRQADKEAELHDVEAEIADLHAVIAEYEDTRQRLADFDVDFYRAALDRIEITERVNRLQRETHDHEGLIRSLAAELSTAEKEADAADLAWRPAAEAAARWQQVDELRTEIDEHQRRRDAARIRVSDAEARRARVERDLSELDGGGFFHRLGNRKRRHELTDALEHASHDVRTAREDFRELYAALSRQTERAEQEVARLEQANTGFPRHSIAELRARRDRAADRLSGVQRRCAEAEAERIRLGDRLAHARAQPQATDDDRAFVAKAGAADLPRQYAELPQLKKRADAAGKETKPLDTKRERLERQLAELGRDAERALIKEATVVAGTLAMARMKRPIWQRTYDYVVVDECAAAAIPEVLFAVSRARVGAVLLGDFMQNAPIGSKKLEKTEPRVRAWLAPRDCFSFFGISSAEAAQRSPGCVVLTEQHRFGAELTRLANATAYGGVLRAASRTARNEIIFVDVDGLGLPARVQPDPKKDGWRRGLWSVGSLVAGALVQQAAQQESNIGVVTPYNAQVDLTKSLLADSGLGELADVGTSHRFQGREFDTVVFDMVEDGDGWVAKARLVEDPKDGGEQWALSGLKLFNVAVTRAKHRLYLVGNGTAVDRARRGPLLAVRDGIKRGDIQVAGVRDILDNLPAPETLTGVNLTLWEALSQFVRYTGLFDESDVPEQLVDHIGRAQRSIWLWSPWISTASERFLPELVAARDRGVDVRVVTMPKWGLKSETEQRAHDELVAALPHTVFLTDQHQKLVVIDDQTTFMGSMNVLSHPGQGGRRETMTIVESAAFAASVLRFERVDELVRVRKCPNCGKRLRVVTFTEQIKNPTLRWMCRSGSSKAALCWRGPEFPPLAGARNQRPLRRNGGQQRR
ncbi:AAA domain-containing protein [Marinitenerispora sediminis]|uniref:AAA domain-containing protein n=1 Tax=Marinitenerispora sediminis TaxID=1931232 RepID=UPI001314274E|nr:AAA domain-containing protein [Marinitenerispora sediminis]